MATNQLYAKDLTLWRPTTNRPHSEDLWVSVAQSKGLARVSIPATTRAVQRENGDAAYLRYPFYFQVFVSGGDISEIAQGETGDRTARLFEYLTHPPISDGNPSPSPVLEAGDGILAEGHEDYSFAETLGTVNYPNDVVAHVGVGGQFAPGPLNLSGTQFSWILCGNETPGAFSPIENISLVSLTGTTPGAEDISLGAYNFLYQSACVIESDALKDDLLLVGGLTAWGAQSLDSVLVNPHTATVVETAPHPTGAAGGAATYLPVAQKVLVTGGLSDDFTDSKNDSHLFDPVAESWAAASQMVTPRRNHKQVVLDSYLGTPGEFVLIMGGKQGALTTDDLLLIGTPTNKCEIYNGATYASTGSMSEAKYAFGVTKLPDGRVLVVGGVGYNPGYPSLAPVEPALELQTAEIFDPATGMWTPVPKMLAPHSHCVCQYISETNRVYVYGGYNSKVIEYLDLQTMTWHLSRQQMFFPMTLGVPVVMGEDLLGVVGGGTYDPGTGGIDLNDDVVLGSTWSQFFAKEVEYNRWDGLNAEWRVSELDPNEGPAGVAYLEGLGFGNYRNTSVSWTESTKFVLAKGVTSSEEDVLGPFALNRQQDFTIGETQLELAQPIFAGTRTGRITVTSGASSITDGWLVFRYGFDDQVGPVRCFGGVDDTTLEIDSGFKFPEYVAGGSVINLVQRGELNAGAGVFWLTASNAGRAAAISALQSIHGAGIGLEITTRYPGDRGLGGEGLPTVSVEKLADIVECYAGDALDEELEVIRGG